MQDFFIHFDFSQKANNYRLDDHDPSDDVIDDFKYSSKKVYDFKGTLLIPRGLENKDSFYCDPLFAICYQLKNKKNECGVDELKKDIENDQFYDVLFSAKENLRFDLDIQNFENQCFSVNDLLIKHGFFQTIFELKYKF